jgi:hypothetical protein
MDLFFINQEKSGGKIRDYFWGLFGVTSWTFIIIKLTMMLKETRETCFLIYINVQEFNILKNVI